MKRLQQLAAIFLVVAVFVIGNALLLAHNFQQMRDHQQIVHEIDLQVTALIKILRATSKMDANARGFYLHQDPRFLDEVDVAKALLHENILLIESLSLKNPLLQQRMDELRALVNQRTEIISINIETARKGGREAIVKNGLVPEGRAASVKLNDFVATLIEEQEKLLADGTLEARSKTRIVYATLGLAVLINLVILGIAFSLVRRQYALQTAALRQQARNTWIQTGIAKLGERMAGLVTPQGVAESSMKFLGSYLSIPALNFYLFNEGRLSRIACHGADPSFATSFNLGESLVGAAARHQHIQQIGDVPEDYFQIASSMGRAKPAELVFLPLYRDDGLLGVVEMASFRKLDDKDLELLEGIQNRLAIYIDLARARQRQQALLEETQAQSEELQAQQEELRVSNEELEEQAKALTSSQDHLQSQQEELRQINEELEAQTRALEVQQSMTNERNSELENARRDLEVRAADLERASNYKSEFLAKMSHELRTPLNSMLILSSLLNEDKDGHLDEQQKEYARTIQSSGNDLLMLINDILDLSKLEAKKLDLRPEAFSIAGLCDQLKAQFEPLLSRKGVDFAIEIEPAVPQTMKNDRQRLEQVLRNFLSNAAKFTEQGSVKLHVGLRPDDQSRIRFSVTDTGVGIPEDKKSSIFEAFEQADSSISRKFGGTGLGLTISRELSVLLQGQIEVETGQDKGSTFTLEVPLQVDLTFEKKEENLTESREWQAPVASPEPPAQPVPIRKEELVRLSKIPAQRTVLIVEDDSAFRKATCEAARRHGFYPVEAESGEVALTILEELRPTAIMLDIKLPGMSGLALLERIKQNSNLRHIPTHIISAMEYQMNALRMGAVGYLGKPADLDAVRAAFSRIEQVLAKKPKRLLIIEDDERQRRAMKELLKSPSVEIMTCAQGKEAFVLLDEIEFDCIIVDLTLPDISGPELLEKIHTKLGESVPPIIVYTGRELSRTEEERLREFSESIILKGAKSPERLLDEVNLFLHRVESELPDSQRRMISEMRMREKIFEGRRALLVDDDIRNIFALTSALESKGLKVTPARNGEEALAELDKNPDFDIVLMDIMMPKMDGFEAMRIIRSQERFRRLPIVALTAKAMKGDHEQCLSAGANDYLPKPVNLMNLISVLKVWLSDGGGLQ